MNLLLYTTLLLPVQIALAWDLRILDGPPLNCTQQGLGCRANAYNCLDDGWLQPREFTPSGPHDLRVQVLYKQEDGKLVPVLEVKWKARTDGSIVFLNGTEVQLLKMSTNQIFCVRYIFLNTIHSMMNGNERWSFSLDRLVVNPGQIYHVTVSNLPKPNIYHDTYNVSMPITVPDCNHGVMGRTVMCIESGSKWMSNISLWRLKGGDKKDVITIGYKMSKYSTKDRMSVICAGEKQSVTITQSDERWVNRTFELDKWPLTCCHFSVEVQPFFKRCWNDCVRHRKKFSICKESTAPMKVPLWHNVALGILPAIGLAGCISCVCWRARKRQKGLHPGKASKEEVMAPPKVSEKPTRPPTAPKKVLIIYSLDHALYKDIVLKLSAFLRAKCGTEVILDLLDTAWLGTVGRMQWLDWQKQQIEKSSDKILILCSRGVQAKWRAMCGEPKVMLREDVRSPMGDMLTPAFSLIVPDLLHPVAFGKYMVTYFDDVCSEEDVPPPFNITIKYKLMKHFEELYFRILDKEKHEPGRVNRIEGIAEDEYFNCPSGKALRDAIEAFHAYQLENPDWFEMECMENEDEALDSDVQGPLLRDLHDTNVMQNVPEWREVPPIFINTVESIEDAKDIVYLTPLINDGEDLVFSHQVHPAAHQEQNQGYLQHPSAHLTESQVCPIIPVNQLDVKPAFSVHLSAQVEENHICTGQHPVHLEESEVPAVHSVAPLTDREAFSVHPAVHVPAGVYTAAVYPMDYTNTAMQELYCSEWTKHQGMAARPSLLVEEPGSSNVPSAEELNRLVALQQSLASAASLPVSSGEEDLSCEPEVLSDWPQAGCVRKRTLSGSDQGYVSRTSPHYDSSLREDLQVHLGTLSELQETCLSLAFKPPGLLPGPCNLADNEYAEQL